VARVAEWRTATAQWSQIQRSLYFCSATVTAQIARQSEGAEPQAARLYAAVNVH